MNKPLLLSLGLTFFSLNIHAQQTGAQVIRGSLWPTPVISVCWDNPTPENQHYRELVQQAVNETWEKCSALKFTDWCPSREKDCDIHIYINDERPHTAGFGKTIRNKRGGMVLNFTFVTWSQACIREKEFCIKAIAVHEFGHAIGLVHEQSRPECNFPNCLGEEDVHTGIGDWSITPCDLQSVMNYCNPRWNNNGLLSELDKSAAQTLYGFPPNSFAGEYKGVEIVHNSEYAGKRKRTYRYNLRIYAKGARNSLDSIKKITYDLSDAGNTFRTNTMESDYRAGNFGIALTKVWGEFKLEVTIHFKDGTIKKVSHYLNIDRVQADPGEIPKVSGVNRFPAVLPDTTKRNGISFADMSFFG